MNTLFRLSGKMQLQVVNVHAFVTLPVTITYLDKLQKIYKNCRSAPTLFKRQAERLKASKQYLKVNVAQSSAKFDCSIKIWDNHFHIQVMIQIYVFI